MVKHCLARCLGVGLRLFFLLSLLLIFPAAGAAATLFCQVSSISPGEHSFKVSCKVSAFPANDKIEIRFLDRFAGIEGLSERLFGLQIRDIKGQRILPEILGGGIYRINPGNATALTLDYELRLARVNGASLDPSKYALTSTLSSQCGFLLLSDVLPQIALVNKLEPEPLFVRLKLQLPEQWQVATTEHETYGSFDVAEPERAVFFIGPLRTHTLTVEQMKIQVALAGDLSLSDVQAQVLIEAIARQQASMMRNQEPSEYLVTLAPFPVPLMGLRSSALTRGRSIVMLLNPDADSQRTLKLYQKHLAHELFHFYLPEAFKARENFEWFWEGFTRYAALLTLNKMRLINFREFLDEISAEYVAYRGNPLRAQVSLVAASQGKFDSPASYDLVYRKGTLVAALYDLELRTQSNGQKTIMDVMRELYWNYKQRELGNSEVLASLRNAGQFEQFIQGYIEDTAAIDLVSVVKPYGLVSDGPATSHRLQVAKKISIKQNMILAAFGH